MRLYTMHKGQHLLIFIMFLSLFFIALLMGMAGPSIITTYEESAAKLVRDANNASVGGEKVKSQIPAGPFLMVTPGLETYRQQVGKNAVAVDIQISWWSDRILHRKLKHFLRCSIDMS